MLEMRIDRLKPLLSKVGGLILRYYHIEITVRTMMLTKGIVQIKAFGYAIFVKRDKIHDFYFHKAKREKYSARSVYKLQNIQEKYHVISKGNKVMDLGAAPGSWTEYLVTLLGKNGSLWAIDEQPISMTCKQKVENAGLQFTFLKQSVFDALPEGLPSMDVVVSDMAPFTQGNRGVDCARSLELINQAFEIAQKHLKRGGHFLVKLFHSDDTIAAAKGFGKHFKFSKLYRPPAVAKDSKEIYFLGMHFQEKE